MICFCLPSLVDTMQLNQLTGKENLSVLLGILKQQLDVRNQGIKLY
jgi:hypothetical protein